MNLWIQINYNQGINKNNHKKSKDNFFTHPYKGREEKRQQKPKQKKKKKKRKQENKSSLRVSSKYVDQLTRKKKKQFKRVKLS